MSPEAQWHPWCGKDGNTSISQPANGCIGYTPELVDDAVVSKIPAIPKCHYLSVHSLEGIHVADSPAVLGEDRTAWQHSCLTRDNSPCGWGEGIPASLAVLQCLRCTPAVPCPPGQFFNSTTDHGAANTTSLTYLQSIPLPTYFVSAGHTEVHLPEEGGEVSPNLHFFGRQGIAQLQGLVVAYLSGKAKQVLTAPSLP